MRHISQFILIIYIPGKFLVTSETTVCTHVRIVKFSVKKILKNFWPGTYLIDDAKAILRTGLAGAFGREIDSDCLRPFAESVSDSYENWLIYELMHPGSVFNPWNSFLDILRNGCIYLISDDKSVLTEYVRDIYRKADKETYCNIGFITAGRKKNRFSGFLSDNRHNSQILVYQFLKYNAAGLQNAKSMGVIRKFLSEYEGRKQKLRSEVVYPLKQTGLIASCPEGFFHVTMPGEQYALSSHSSDGILEIYKRIFEKISYEIT